MLVEHARSLGGIADAIHAEYSDMSGTEVVSLLTCSLDGQTIDLDLAPASQLASIHGGASTTTEHTTCNYGLNPAVADIAQTGGMRVSAVDETGEVRAVELDDHPFFIGTLYQPQLRSTPGAPHPIFAAFVNAVLAANG